MYQCPALVYWCTRVLRFVLVCLCSSLACFLCVTVGLTRRTWGSGQARPAPGASQIGGAHLGAMNVSPAHTSVTSTTSHTSFDSPVPLSSIQAQPKQSKEHNKFSLFLTTTEHCCLLPNSVWAGQRGPDLAEGLRCHVLKGWSDTSTKHCLTKGLRGSNRHVVQPSVGPRPGSLVPALRATA